MNARALRMVCCFLVDVHHLFACFFVVVFVLHFFTHAQVYVVLILEPLHGVTYACYQLVAIHYLNELAPHNMKATAQGETSTLCRAPRHCRCSTWVTRAAAPNVAAPGGLIVCCLPSCSAKCAAGLKSTVASIGTFVGSVLGGWLLKTMGKTGALIMYRGGSVLMFSTMCLYLVAHHHLTKQGRSLTSTGEGGGNSQVALTPASTPMTIRASHRVRTHITSRDDEEWGHDPSSPSVRMSATMDMCVARCSPHNTSPPLTSLLYLTTPHLTSPHLTSSNSTACLVAGHERSLRLQEQGRNRTICCSAFDFGW